MACPYCGSPSGSDLFPCHLCVERRKAERRSLKAATLAPPQTKDVGYDLSTNPLVLALGSVVIFLILFAYFLFVNPLTPDDPVATMLFATMGVFGVVAFVSWGVMWARMLVHQPLWCIFSLIIPALVYRYIIIYGINLKEDATPVIPFAVHFIAILLVLVACRLLSGHLNVSMLESLFIYQVYVTGGASGSELRSLLHVTN